MRIGHGFDAHRFCPGDHVVIGGVNIPFDMGVEAHSDGDVLIHALIDALLGAAALGDIGRHFPDNEEEYSGINSRILLRKAVKLISGEELVLGNMDATVVAQRPRLNQYIEVMRTHLADDLGVSLSQVNIKATTTEKMGYTGRGEGISAHVVVLLMPV